MRILLLLIAMAFTALPASAQTLAQENEIFYRASLGRADDVKLLLDQGTDANAKDSKGTPLLCLAAARTDAEGLNVVKVLHDAGADMNLRDRDGRNALFYAAEKGNEEVVQYLLESKINYYAVDSSGDIARTIAYREGHNHIVRALDDFVKSETEKVAEQYRELSKALEEQYKAQEVRQKEAAAAAAQEALDQSRKAHEEQERMKREQEDQLKEAIEEQQEVADKQGSDEAKKLQYDLAFHACAFQYWSFCRDAGQTSELKGTEQDTAIASHREKTASLRQSMQDDFQFDQKYTQKIINSAQRSVFNQLNAMPSKTYRFQHGVCQMNDLVKRCNEAAQQPGEVIAPAKKKKPKTSMGGGRMGNMVSPRRNRP